MDRWTERWTDGWMDDTGGSVCHCAESGPADMGRREEKRVHTVVSFIHLHVASHHDVCNSRTHLHTKPFVCLVCVSTFPPLRISFSPTCLSPALIQAIGLVNRVVTTHWNKASATLANLNLLWRTR